MPSKKATAPWLCMSCNSASSMPFLLLLKLPIGNMQMDAFLTASLKLLISEPFWEVSSLPKTTAILVNPPAKAVFSNDSKVSSSSLPGDPQ